jgi:hypothetical protein
MGLVLLGLLLVAGTSAADSAPVGAAADSAPAATYWSSGWQSINQGEVLTFSHNLGTDPDDYAVELWFKDTDGGLGINRRGYGGVEWSGNWHGAYWQHLTSNTIQVHRFEDDNAADEVFIRVWITPPPSGGSHDSGWLDINKGQTIIVPHNVGITDTDLSVGLWFSGTLRGIHNYTFGGLTADGPQWDVGAHWHNLTSNSIQVTRHADDVNVEQVRVFVLEPAAPHYDSLDLGWQPIARGDVSTFTHDLHVPPEFLLVRAECFSSSIGINLAQAGGNIQGWPTLERRGTNVQNVTSSHVEVYRWPDDDTCPYVRVRVWSRLGLKVHLPILLRDF